MRLTFVISSLGPGGAERVMSLMVSYWAEKGWPVDLLTLDSGEAPPFYPLHPGVRVRPLGIAKRSKNPFHALAMNGRRLAKLRQTILESRPDAVISFIDRTNVLVLLATVGASIPVIVSERSNPASTPLHFPWPLLRRIAYARAARVVLQSPRSLSAFSKSLQQRCAVIPNPVLEPELRRTRHMPSASGVVLGMGRLTRQKGFDLLLQAFASVAKARPLWKLAIWGEGPERERLNALIKTYGLQGQAELKGITKDPLQEMVKSDIFVLSSRFEGFPNVLAEAMSCGLPVIAFDCPTGPAELIQNQVNGLLVPAEDVSALSAALQQLVESEATREKLSTAALDVSNRFSMEKIMTCWEDALSGTKQ